MRVKREALFIELSDCKCPPTEEGRLQFYNYQSSGTKPTNPDKYFTALESGKWQLDFLIEEYRKMYFNGEWWGWLQIWKDWEGKRWVIPCITKWHPNRPEWVTEEITRKELRLHYGI